ncbi:hypothetical protein [uncultured Jannaschia sp.]|nr:hypothetical protein [uncultured Jannaschia sp.]
MARDPLLVISHFTNIEELTNFSVYEGEIRSATTGIWATSA